MNKKITIFSILTAAVLLLSACGGTAATEKPSIEEKQVRKVSVNGTGTVTLSPDMATVMIGVQSEDENAEDALTENNKKADRIMASLAKFGIEEKDIRTTNFRIIQRQEFTPNDKIRETYYQVINTVQVTVNDLDILGQVLDSVVRSGANNINNIQFDISDREGAMIQAMEAAMLNAHLRAETLATAGGAELGEVLTISTFVFGGGFDVAAPAALSIAADSLRAAVPIATGEMEISVQVSVEYLLK